MRDNYWVGHPNNGDTWSQFGRPFIGKSQKIPRYGITRLIHRTHVPAQCNRNLDGDIRRTGTGPPICLLWVQRILMMVNNSSSIMSSVLSDMEKETIQDKKSKWNLDNVVKLLQFSPKFPNVSYFFKSCPLEATWLMKAEMIHFLKEISTLSGFKSQSLMSTTTKGK